MYPERTQLLSRKYVGIAEEVVRKLLPEVLVSIQPLGSLV